MGRNWHLCLFCQESTNEQLSCPSKSNKLQGEKIVQCYQQVLQNLNDLRVCGQLPSSVRVDDLLDNLPGHDGGGDTANDNAGLIKTMLEKGVFWHTNCHKAVNKQKAEQAKRKLEEADNPSKVLKTNMRSEKQAFARIITELEGGADATTDLHHEQQHSFQLKFQASIS
jgi:hypothetical protein